ncbi:AraC family transcriptional regulator [Paenibacillus apiarius]|uniref:AraC family transcriptional regulator n=1 Tax=Paenibacillus apiarius TaxID=46240 RepID=UPI002DB6F18C|nr:AraC family transcriptional regulator [Paenibacillus apiarius]
MLASDATLEEIAIRVGYPDKYYFSRIFKQHTGTSPIQFRDNNNRYQCYREGDIPMLKSTKMLAAILFCLSLLLGSFANLRECNGRRSSSTGAGIAGGNGGQDQDHIDDKGRHQDSGQASAYRRRSLPWQLHRIKREADRHPGEKFKKSLLFQ